MNHASLFTGIGGFDLAAEGAGFNNIFQVEKDAWCRRVLAKNFPEVKRYEEIKQFNGTEYGGAIDLLTGGFPCQPFSTAGKRKGADDDRYLWPEMLRVISEVKPTFVIGENVAGLTSMEDGKTLEGIFTDLEAEGYTLEPYIIPAAGVGAWHRRDRIWIIGYAEYHGRDAAERGRNDQEPSEQAGQDPVRESTRTNSVRSGDATHTNGERRGTDQGKSIEEPNRGHEFAGICEDVSNSTSERFEKQRGAGANERERRGTEFECDNRWLAEPGVGRVANGIPNRVDRLKGLGNAIVPQVAYEIMKVIHKFLDNNLNAERL